MKAGEAAARRRASLDDVKLEVDGRSSASRRSDASPKVRGSLAL